MNFKLIHDFLESSNLEVVVELSLENYFGNNYYINISYDNLINKYKVIYIPIDIVDYDRLDRFVSFQLIDDYYVNYLLNEINNFKDEFKYIKNRNYKNKYIENDLITLSIKISGEYYTFYSTEYIPRELDYLYELINILFTYVPNSITEIGRDILGLLDNSSSYIEYNDCINFDLFKDSLEFFNNKKYKISYLELVNDKYYCIVEGHLVILRYLKNKNILYLYCDNKSNKYYYSVIDSIRKNQFNDFFRIRIIKDIGNIYALCYKKDKNYYYYIKGDKLDKIENNDLVIEIEKDEI